MMLNDATDTFRCFIYILKHLAKAMLALSRIAEGYDEAQKAFAEAGAIPSLIQVMVNSFENETTWDCFKGCVTTCYNHAQ